MTEQLKVFVKLLDEGVDVSRPVKVEQLGSNEFCLIGPIPETEIWEFQPGDTVRCEERNSRRGPYLIAIEKIR